MTIKAYDAHVHCGTTLTFERIKGLWDNANIMGGAAFSPVEEIYDRYDPFFKDSMDYKNSRERVHDYLLNLSIRELVFPYFFVWNDFAPIPDGFMGIKWHRHADEPHYDYGAQKCDEIINRICEKKLPIVLEEELVNTIDFISRINGATVVIIPHLGALNGGYHNLKSHGIFENPMVWVDTALAGEREIEDYAANFGHERMMFGSDYPFGLPGPEKQKIESIFSGEELEAILSKNLLRLLGKQT